MKLIKLKKTSSTPFSCRGLRALQKSVLSSNKPLKLQSFGLLNKAGRNNLGLITAFHRGGGHKQKYRIIDFTRKDTMGVVCSIEYDPNRISFIARVFNETTKKYSYILAPKNLFVGSVIKSGECAEIAVGHSMPLEKIPVGSLIHNLSVSSGKKGQFARAAGASAQLLQKTKGFGRIRLCSGEHRLVSLKACASLGMLSNDNQKLIRLGKAGRSRWLNKRPHVRGVAMNPIDHPHGGGEGKTSGGRPSVTPWGKPTKGPKTSRSKNPFIIVSRRGKNINI